MKMNKIIIPAAMLAVGVALVGSVSSTLAWYQYSTKAQAAYIGTSVGQSENVEIQKKDTKWATNLPSSEVEKLAGADVKAKNLIPVTPGIAGDGNLGKDDALPAVANFENSIETGIAGYGEQRGEIATNVVQFTLNIHYKQIDSNVAYKAKKLKLVDLTIIDSTANSQVNQGDLYKAIRVHFSAGSNNRLYANGGNSTDETVTTDTYGNLDTGNNGLDNDGNPIYDKVQSYEWDTNAGTNVMYGTENSQQVAYNSSYADNLDWEVGTLPENEAGLAVTVTIWLEGWQKLSGVPADNADRVGESPRSAMWDPQSYVNKKFNVGMRFQAEDIPAQNP